MSATFEKIHLEKKKKNRRKEKKKKIRKGLYFMQNVTYAYIIFCHNLCWKDVFKILIIFKTGILHDV